MTRFISFLILAMVGFWGTTIHGGASLDLKASSKVGNHWAFELPKDHSPSSVKQRHWVKSPIDHFILKKLEENGLQPAQPVEKRNLIRRVTFDLTGLPPKPEDVDAFEADNSSDAFSRLLNRLLDSPEFGERWGRHWLDVVRYADSNGLEVNEPYPNAWRYRDYVIGAFNQDKPFDQFIREQIAGDLLSYQNDEQRFQQLIATGFLMLGPKPFQESNREKLAMDVADEQIDVTSRAFLGLTVSCARCHDHKYDPIPTRDYYALAGIFRSTMTLANSQARNQPGRRWLERPLVAGEKAKELEEHSRELERLAEKLRVVRETPGGIRSDKLPGIVVDNSAALLTGQWKEYFSATAPFVDRTYHHDGDSGKGKKSATYIPRLPHSGLYEVLVAYVPKSNRPANVPVTVQSTNGTQKVTVNQAAPATYKDAFVSIGAFPFMAGTNGSVTISNEGTKGFVAIDAVLFVPVDEWRLALEEEQAAKLMVQKKNGQDNVAGQQDLSMGGTPMDVNLEIQSEMQVLQEKVSTVSETAMAVQDGTIKNSRINLRGDVDKLGDEVPRGFLTAIAGKKTSLPETHPSSGRLELANWISSPDNPLTARVAVNRIWQHLFGQGLVDSPDNFGILAEKPVHSELLDHLAVKFIAEGWSVKKMIRYIMLSNAYQMSCQYDDAAYAKDQENNLFWRMNRKRLEAEAIRDAILAISSQLNPARGGPTEVAARGPLVRPNSMDIQFDESLRRSVYLPVMRNNVSDLFQVFDFADPHTVAGKRHKTSAATQALFMMNSEFVAKNSEKWAELLLAGEQSDFSRIRNAYRQAFGRSPSGEEIERAKAFLSAAPLQGSNDPGTSDRMRGWQAFCQAIICSTEFRFLD